MKKKIFLRALFGLPMGIAIGFVIPIVLSACIGDGMFYPVMPELIAKTGSELNAVFLQTVLCAVLGAVFGAGSIIWELDAWSIAKQSAVYFGITCVAVIAVAYVTNWMVHSMAGLLSYLAIFVVIFLAVWMVSYFVWKRKIEKMNQQMQHR